MNVNAPTSTHQLLDEVEARMKEQFAGHPSALVANLEQLILAGGKRIRPMITLLIGNMFGADKGTLLNLAAAIEMLHTATLVHDDLVDHADKRRGQPTINAAFSTSATVLAGDLAFAAAARLAAATNRIAAMKKFSETLQFIVNGEITYMFSNGDRGSQEAYYQWIHAKTASVFETAAGMAATIGSASESEITASYQFGYNFGMAFQITDDVLDFTGDPSVLGKPTGNDLRQGILTLPTILYLTAHANNQDMHTVIKHNTQNPEQLENLITEIQQSSVIEQSINSAHQYLQQGLRALSQLPNTTERTELARMAEQVVNRNQ